MKVFVSYARLDRAVVDSLLDRLRGIGHDVWYDERLAGGQNWWERILDRIRWCDVFVVTRSANSARSRICRAEREYASALDRFILPVRVGPSAEDLDGLGMIETVDWQAPGEDRIAELAVAMPTEERLRPLPDPPPAPPPIPFVSLDRPYDILTAPTLSRADEDEFLRLLRPLVDDPDASETVIDLLRRFAARPAEVTAAGLAEANNLLMQARRTIRPRRGTSTLQDLRHVLGRAERGHLLPILGFGLTEGMFGSRSSLAERLTRENSAARTGQLSNDLPGVAQFLVGFHGEYDMRELVLEEFRRTVAGLIVHRGSVDMDASLDDLFVTAWRLERSPDDPYRILADLPCPIFVNAHPSRLLFEALVEAGKQPRVEYCRWRGDAENWPTSVFQSRERDFQPTVDEPLVFQVFGSFEHPETLALTEDDYLRFLHHVGRREGATAEDAVPMCVKAAAATSRLLMVGFGLEELDARVLMMALVEQEGGAKRKVSSLAVQVDPDGPAASADQAREYLKRYFSDERRIQMYWGSAEEFAADLAALRAESP